MSFKVSILGLDLDNSLIIQQIVEAINNGGFYGLVKFTYTGVLEISEYYFVYSKMINS